MMDFTETPLPEVVMLPDGCLQCGGIIHEPWPSLRIRPHRNLAFQDEIIRAAPGSPFYSYASRIPDEIRDRVRSAPDFSFALLEMVAAHPERGLDLLQHCPALAVLLVRSYRPERHGERRGHVARMLAKPWRELLHAFQLPVRRRTVRLLRKLPIEHCTPQTVDRLVSALRRRGRTWLHSATHLPRFTRDTVSLLALEPGFVNPALLAASTVSDQDEQPVHSLITSVRALLAEAGRLADWPYGRSNLEQLLSAESRLRRRVFEDCLVTFPPPPFPGLPGEIEPIRDYRRLVQEGEDQNNCAPTFVAEIAHGLTYFFAIYRPERATVALHRGNPDRRMADSRPSRREQRRSEPENPHANPCVAQHPIEPA